MQYKTMVLELLRDRPQLYEALRSRRQLMETLDRYSRQLKQTHQAWKDCLNMARPGSDEAQIASEALEMALQELIASMDSSPPASPPSGDDSSSAAALPPG